MQKKRKGEQMKKAFMICVGLLAGLSCEAWATSPMPEGVKPGMTATVCAIHLAVVKERDKGTREELTSTFAFEASEEKKDVLEWVTRYVSDRMSERSVAEFRLDCRFPK